MQPDTWIMTLGVIERRPSGLTYYEIRYNTNEMKEVFGKVECAILEAGRQVTRTAGSITTVYVSATALARTALGLREG